MEKATSPDRPSAVAEDPFGLCGQCIDDKYRIDSVVGRGGYGLVYRGVHTGFDEPIAVKCLRLPGELAADERAALLKRLQAEGRVLHRLSRLSSGIVQALDVGAVTTPSNQWVPYLVLEWLEGETLAEYLRGRRAAKQAPLNLEQTLDLLEPAARALSVAHRQKVAHRDVKPENLYLTEVAGQRTLKVLDFGIAKVLSQHATFTAAPAATQKQASAFTPSYGAPEQFNKRRGATGPWTDVFALALIAVECVSGERALQGDDATQLYIAAADPAARPTLRYHGIECANAIERVLLAALAVEPSDRYQDALEFWTALREAAGAPSEPERVAPDVSDTGEFISHHAIDLDAGAAPSARPAAAREAGRAGASQQPARERDSAAPPRVPTEGEPSKPQPAPEADPPAVMPASPATSAAAPMRAVASSGRAPTPPQPPASGNASAPAASGKWLPLVMLLALGGAALLYLQLREIEPDNRSDTTPGPRSASPRASAEQPADGGEPAYAAGDGGALAPADAASDAPSDAAGDAGDDAGDGAVAPPPAPEGMVFIAGGADGSTASFFIDRAEVSTGAYQRCVMAGRCVRATRVVLGEMSARALGGVDGVDSTTAPEQIAAAWGPRCNAGRNKLDHPINCVNFGSASDYCAFVDKRLPRSAEWTLAASGPEGRRFPWGNAQPECATACYGLNGSCVGYTSEVASCPSGSRQGDRTPAGVIDLAANVAEWVSDEAPGGGRSGPPFRLLRGGSFTDEAPLTQSATSRGVPPVTAHVTIGFRCALDLPAPD